MERVADPACRFSKIDESTAQRFQQWKCGRPGKAEAGWFPTDPRPSRRETRNNSPPGFRNAWSYDQHARFNAHSANRQHIAPLCSSGRASSSSKRDAATSACFKPTARTASRRNTDFASSTPPSTTEQMEPRAPSEWRAIRRRSQHPTFALRQRECVARRREAQSAADQAFPARLRRRFSPVRVDFSIPGFQETEIRLESRSDFGARVKPARFARRARRSWNSAVRHREFADSRSEKHAQDSNGRGRDARNSATPAPAFQGATCGEAVYHFPRQARRRGKTENRRNAPVARRRRARSARACSCFRYPSYFTVVSTLAISSARVCSSIDRVIIPRRQQDVQAARPAA